MEWVVVPLRYPAGGRIKSTTLCARSVTKRLQDAGDQPGRWILSCTACATGSGSLRQRGELFDGCLLHRTDAPDLLQEALLAGRPDTGTSSSTDFVMRLPAARGGGDGEAVGLVPHPLQQVEGLALARIRTRSLRPGT